ncbi:uncharacterized protein LOC114451121 isoform X2 [Parambassis ranga]|uniref:Uncharacterized protein LOC114451121 isoform X2 n=1 Tax=Parambassis ranga TaxID=210632 RepID=A0A6P7KDM4_9TELE|nr:uncharacterized protein LOC114451121 isoform X2 [Parambassis ranga]
MHRVADMYERRPHIQRIIRWGLLAMEFNGELDEDDNENWQQERGHFHGNHTRSASSVYQPLPPCYSSARDLSCPASVKRDTKESNGERKESKKSREKADKRRLKKQRQKEKKRLEKVDKEKQGSENNEEKKEDSQLPKPNENKPVNDKYEDKPSFNPLVSNDADTSDSSDLSDGDDDTQSDSEGLDMTSTFVSNAALIAKRKLEQRPKSEKEKKKTLEKEAKPAPEKPMEDQKVEKKDSATSSSFEDNVKTSTELANIGNKFASAGDFNMAIKYFTDAIKFNPTEYKLFGNRSFCFEKLQEYEKALADAELSLGICPGWVKGLFRKGRALAGLKRYDEAAQAFRDVLKLDSSCGDATQELMRVQIIQLMEYGFTREQSSNALIIHVTVKKALEVLSKLHVLPGAVQNSSLPTLQVANVTGVSPVLSANTYPPPPAAAQSQDSHRKTSLGAAHDMSSVHSQPKLMYTQSAKAKNDNKPPHGLFPIWVGNLNYPVPESVIADLFNRAGVVQTVKVLTYKRCAFVNFAKQEHCDEAIRRFHGYELNGNRLAVRYPDRIPSGIGISKSALRADHLHDENVRVNEDIDGRSACGSQRPYRPYKPVPGHRGNY